MKITCILDSLGSGGAERVMTLLTAGLSDRGHRTVIITLDSSIPDFYEVDSRVERVRAPIAPGVRRWFDIPRQIERIKALRACIERQTPDLIISFVDVTNILTLLACRAGKAPVIVCEHINPLYYSIGAHWRILRRLLYPGAARVVMLTEDTLSWANSLRPRWRTAVIPDPVIAPKTSLNPPRPQFFMKPYNILAMGRLTAQKGFDMLLRAFAPIAANFPQWQLTILGQGPDRKKLEDLAVALGLKDAVRLPGTVKTPNDVLRHTDIFVLSSRFEGFGMALAEAMACGVPSISFDCPSGPSVIIRHGIDGILVPAGDEKALTGAMVDLVTDEAKRRSIAAQAPDVVSRFGIESYLNSWCKLIEEVAPSLQNNYGPLAGG